MTSAPPHPLPPPTPLDQVRFTPVRLREGYDMGQVDRFLEAAHASLASGDRSVTARDVRNVRFTAVRLRGGYDMRQVDTELDRLGAALTRHEDGVAAGPPLDTDHTPAVIDDGTPNPNWGWEFRLEDFVIDRLDELLAAAEASAAGPDRDQRLAQARALRATASQHSIYVHADGSSSGRCYTCPPVHGVPCTTMRLVASIWVAHPDHPHPEQAATAGLRALDATLVNAGTFRRKQAAARAAT